MKNIETYIDYIAHIVESLGVITVVIGIVLALARYVYFIKQPNKFSYINLRQAIGKTILLGLEILIAADIIATVVIKPSLKSVSTLGLIVIIRIILSLSIQVELEGRFPWQANKEHKLK